MQTESQEYTPIPQQGGYIPPGQTEGYALTLLPEGNTETTGVSASNNVPYQSKGNSNQPVPQAGSGFSPSFGGSKYIYISDPMDELAMSTGVSIRQEPQFLEQITGCESPNRYYVFSKSPQGDMKLLFKCK